MADEQPGATIEDYLIEDRTFPPPEDFKERSLVASPSTERGPPAPIEE